MIRFLLTISLAIALSANVTAAPQSKSGKPQGAAPADVSAINTCLKGAEEKGGFGAECVGLVADPCIKEAVGKNDDVARKNACAERELAIWTAKMREALKQVQSGDFKNIVADSQKTFTASRDRFCAVFDKIEPGIYPAGASYCRMRETANRTLSLIMLGVAVNEH